MSELVEKVMEALSANGVDSCSLEAAQAAIAAVFDWMAEPSEGACIAGEQDDCEGWNISERDARVTFQAMLAHLRREALG